MTDGDARALAKTCGAAQRAYLPVVQLVHAAQHKALPLKIRRQANAVIEELDLLRHFLREATLQGVIEPPTTARSKRRKRA
jgi:hypothetical protein